MIPGIIIKACDDIIDYNTAQWYAAYHGHAMT